MRVVTFDIETSNVFSSLAGRDATDLDLAVVAIHDSATGEYTSYLQEELPRLWPIIERADALVGFNSDTFDIPLLNKYYPGDLTKLTSIDLLKEIHAALGRRLRLQSIAEATLGRGKSGDGTKAVDWWQKGEIEKVRSYCIEDVRITRELFDYALAHGKLKYKDLGEKRDIKIDTSRWLAADPAALTHTLPF